MPKRSRTAETEGSHSTEVAGEWTDADDVEVAHSNVIAGETEENQAQVAKGSRTAETEGSHSTEVAGEQTNTNGVEEVRNAEGANNSRGGDITGDPSLPRTRSSSSPPPSRGEKRDQRPGD